MKYCNPLDHRQMALGCRPVMEKPLQNMTLLVTRPAQQSEKLRLQLSNLGAKVLLLPTIVISDIQDKTLLSEQLLQLRDQDIAIFISPNAVFKASSLIKKSYSTWPPKVKIAAIGASTASALREQGLTVDFFPLESFNSEGLLSLSALQAVATKKVLIFCGEGGRQLLAETLRQRGAVVTQAIVYKREMPSDPNELALFEQKIDIVICTSNTGLQNLIEMVGQANRARLQNMSLLVVSERMASMAKTLGFVKPPLIADNATDSAIIKYLIKLAEDKLHGKYTN